MSYHHEEKNIPERWKAYHLIYTLKYTVVWLRPAAIETVSHDCTDDVSADGWVLKYPNYLADEATVEELEGEKGYVLEWPSELLNLNTMDHQTSE